MERERLRQTVLNIVYGKPVRGEVIAIERDQRRGQPPVALEFSVKERSVVLLPYSEYQPGKLVLMTDQGEQRRFPIQNVSEYQLGERYAVRMRCLPVLASLIRIDSLELASSCVPMDVSEVNQV